jgi:predicted glutamine amidotransferase
MRRSLRQEHLAFSPSKPGCKRATAVSSKARSFICHVDRATQRCSVMDMLQHPYTARTEKLELSLAEHSDLDRDAAATMRTPFYPVVLSERTRT